MQGRQLFVLGGFFLVGGLFIVAVGIALTQYYNKEIKRLVNNGAKLTTGSDAFIRWYNGSQSQQKMEYFYVFNITNPEDVIQSGQSVSVEELGPFAYRVNDILTDVALSTDNQTLLYGLKKIYTFDAASSEEHRDTDIITVINFPILSLVTKLRSKPNAEVEKELARRDEQLFIQISVEDLLWGYNSTELFSFNRKYHYFNDTVIGIFHQTGVPPKTRDMGVFNISTGAETTSSVWKLNSWNNETLSTYWRTSSSNAIKGTTGYSWHPYLMSSDRLDRFDPDWCRSIYLSHEGKTKDDRLSVDTFIFPPSVLNSSLPENTGFCQPTPDGKPCLAAGVLNITTCSTEEIPWILSQPHFYDSDVSFLKMVRNMTSPVADLHGSRADMDLLTGEVVEARYRKQFNFHVKNDYQILNATRHFNASVIIPVAWINEVYSLSVKERDRILWLYAERSSNSRMAYGVIAFGIFILFLIFLVAIVILTKKITKSAEERKPILLRH